MSIGPVENLGKDLNGNVDYSLPGCTLGSSVTLVANTEKTVTTPSGFNRAFFAYAVGTNVFYGFNTTAVLPGSSFADSTVELNPSARQINEGGGDTLHFICATASYVQIRFDRGAPSGKQI